MLMVIIQNLQNQLGKISKAEKGNYHAVHSNLDFLKIKQKL